MSNNLSTCFPSTKLKITKNMERQYFPKNNQQLKGSKYLNSSSKSNKNLNVRVLRQFNILLTSHHEITSNHHIVDNDMSQRSDKFKF